MDAFPSGSGPFMKPPTGSTLAAPPPTPGSGSPWIPSSGSSNSGPSFLLVTILAFGSVSLIMILTAIKMLLIIKPWERRNRFPPDDASRRIQEAAAGEEARARWKQRDGLDESLIGQIPTFVYKATEWSGPRECTVCLCDYEDGETLKVLAVCSHAFHDDCIESWLHTKTTCPICRVDLQPPEEFEESADAVSIQVAVVEVTDATSALTPGDEQPGSVGEAEGTPITGMSHSAEAALAASPVSGAEKGEGCLILEEVGGTSLSVEGETRVALEDADATVEPESEEESIGNAGHEEPLNAWVSGHGEGTSTVDADTRV